MEEIKQALYLKEQLDALRPIDKEQEGRIMQKFRLDWNYHSNHLEGNSLTYGETKALILFGITALGKPLKDTLEITGHNEAINWVLEMVKGEQPLTENFIRELHSLLLKDSYNDSKNAEGKIVPRKISARKYKTTPNHVLTKTGEIFYFASPEETPAKMFDLLNWYKEKLEAKEINTIFLAAEFHYKFIRIHPFDDGNGRTARILMNFILMQFGFPPVIIRTEDKANYFAALQLADAGNIEPFITYIAQNLNRSLQIMIAGANGEEIDEDDDLDKEIALLEQRLNGFGEKLNKVKSKEIINEILNDSILEIAKRVKNKLEKFDNHYLNKKVYINVDNFSYSLGQTISIEENCRLIKIYFDFNTIKKSGLENFSFIFEMLFSFNPLTYSILVQGQKEQLLVKNYLSLSEIEIQRLVNIILKKHNLELNEYISKK
jgi:Fic family protein